MRFGEMPDGAEVGRYEIYGGGVTAWVLSYGAVLQDLRLTGHAPPLVLGFPEFAPYLTDSPYFGAIVGRCGNRIGQGRFMLNGQRYQLERNIGAHHLHGGSHGTGRRNWSLVEKRADVVRLSLALDDGEMGYPGAMRVEARYACPGDGCLALDITATTTAPTVANFAPHSYWNLDGTADTRHHVIEIKAMGVLEVDDEFIPTGKMRDLAGTRFDFRHERPLADHSLIDHNLCLAKERVACRPIGHLRSTHSGIRMEIETTEPGLQVYDGYKIDTVAVGLGGQPYGACAGVALEPQIWPDAINHAGFPSPILLPEAHYHQQTRFHFSKPENPD